uniref:Uncharacterized protein n=1 Tax=Aegilops tauschii subsp. strangulata TaxID=200361 RepID=A0A453LSK9_AEGTS
MYFFFCNVLSSSLPLSKSQCFVCIYSYFLWTGLRNMCCPFFILLQERFLDKAKLSPDYFIADCEDMLKVAAIVDELPLALHDKYVFCQSPVDVRDDISTQGLTQFAENYAKKGTVRLKEIFTPGTLRVPTTHNQLQELESVHKVLELYVWLSYRFDDSFPDRELAASQKSICSMLIEEYLERSGWQQQGQRRVLRTPRKLRREYDALQLRGYFREIDARSK